MHIKSCDYVAAEGKIEEAHHASLKIGHSKFRVCPHIWAPSRLDSAVERGRGVSEVLF